MLSTGVRTPIGIKVLGADIKKIEELGTHLEMILKDVPGTRIVAFRGKKHDLLVKWVENSGEWESRGVLRAAMPHFDGVPAGKCTDYLGRVAGVPAELTGAPVFEELPLGACDRLPLTPVPRGESRGGDPCAVVLQPDLPRAELRIFKPEWTEENTYVLPPNSETTLALWVYNFSDKAVRGPAPQFDVPDGWSCRLDEQPVEVAPGERARLSCTLRTGSLTDEPGAEFWVRLRGEFGDAGRPAAAFRVRLLKPDGEVQ